MATKGETPKGSKPFFWVSLEKPPRKDKPPDHDRFQDWSGRLEVEIEVVSTYLYVGSGTFELFPLDGQEQVCYAFARRNGELVIPGTSVKGAVRNVLEAISNSCVRQTAKKEGVHGSHRACEGVDKLCPACRLFGTTGYRGRVHFSDAVPVGEVKTERIKIADLWPPRLAKGRKFYQTREFQALDKRPEKSHRFLEVVPRRSRFAASLYFENASSAEMGLLMRAWGLDVQESKQESKVVHAFPIKLGGAKPRCLGAVYLRPKRLYLIQEGPDFFSALRSGGTPASLREKLRVWLEDKSLLDGKAWETFLREAKLKHEPCPVEVY
jgi:CRISPR/Cas system CSM-associated protein Csm3 (group 7 of RAMP superfamily)